MPTPTLANVSGVELMHAGTWDLSSGLATFSRADLLSAVAAQDCPAVHRPLLKLGHLDGRVAAATEDGQPTIGWIGGMRPERDGHALVGDYRGLPAWMTELDDAGNCVIASAFPYRSIEGSWDYRCALGHTHPFVITGVALLGETPPGIGTLASLQDVAALYTGVAASSPTSGVPVTVTIHATGKESAVPNPNPVMVAASVTIEDLREEFREKATYDQWITEIILDPLALIVMDDGTRELYRIPVAIGADGTVTFGTAVQVAVAYVDDTTEDEAPLITAARGERIVYASRAESRPPATASDPPLDAGGSLSPGSTVAVNTGEPEPVVTQPTPNSPAAEPDPITEPEDHVSDLSGIRSRLGLPDTADEAAVMAALDEKLGPPTPETTPTEPETVEPEPELVTASAPQLPAGVVAIDEATLADLRRDATAGAAARLRQQHEDRDKLVAAAVRAGKIPPSRTQHWTTLYDLDPTGTQATLDALAAGVVPVDDPRGYAGNEDTDNAGDEDDARLFAPDTLAGMKG